MKFKVIGCGDAFGTGGRFNTCFLLDAGSSKTLIDCGASSLIALKAAGESPDDIDAAVISHLHGDHFGGLVFWLREATLYKRRTRALTIAGPPGIRERLGQAMEAFFPSGWQEPETFSLSIVELSERQPTQVGPVIATAFPAEHFSGSPSYSLRIELAGKVVTYSGDTLWTEHLEQAADGADLFICECYSFEHRRGTHVDFKTLQANAGHLQARRLLLTHLGPDMLSNLDFVARNFDVASDGLCIDL